MDFYQIGMREIERGPKKGEFEIFPDFVVGRSKDLMVRGGHFYAIWDDAKGLWSTDEYDVQRLVDEELEQHALKIKADTGAMPHVKYLRSFGSQGWNQFRKFMQNISDNSHPLDANLTFADTVTKKTDYVSRRLPYSLTPGDYSAWNELVGTLYNTEQRAKIEWVIGAIVSGDSKKIHKFLVFYGPPMSGKSTIMNIMEGMFDGYVTTFDAKALGSSNGAFATDVFRWNPLLAIQQDGDMSRIDDNTKLNSIVAHEYMTMNEKFKASYTARVNAFLVMGTNQPVKISDAKSGLIRRLIDVHPTGVKIPTNHYFTLMSRIEFEYGAIAAHCLEVYRSMGKNYYNGYRPLEMMLQTDVFFNFVEAHFDIFKDNDGITLRQAYAMYKQFCEDTGIERKLPAYKVREELRNYFEEFKDRVTLEDGTTVRSYYTGFTANKFKTSTKKDALTFSLVLDETISLLDELYADEPAQGWVADKFGDQIPANKWSRVRTKLKQIDTSDLHFVKIPQQHIVIDFDLKDEKGEKSLERNLEAASVWPPTYAELSKGGAGVHLHYIYDGDVTELSPIYSEGIEVKTLLGDASLRRRLTRCNNIPVATLNGGLPIKEKKMQTEHTIKSEKSLRDLIERNLRKQIHPSTVSSVSFIAKILDEAYNSGMTYDLSDMRGRITVFANNSTNQALKSLQMVMNMKFQGKNTDAFGDAVFPPKHNGDSFFKPDTPREGRLAFFDVEVYPNLFVVCWSYENDDNVVRMINPDAKAMEGLFKMRLVGFYNRRYDNHICWARFLGYNNQQLYELSQKLIAGTPGAMFGEAYNLSYTDIYDYSSKKQSLKKFEIELGIHHMELDIPWDEPVPEDKIPLVVEYCANDVIATKAVHKDREQDYVARQILCELSGLSMNDTTQKHTAKIIFGNDRRPQDEFIYTDLSKEFPGYEFDPTKPTGKSSYQGEDPGEGGYVYAEPGIYTDVALLDVASMHPTSIIKLNLFGIYTPKFEELYNARLAIKHKDYKAARKMMDGKLEPYLENEDNAKALSDALKIVINIVYGLTSAKFDNPFRDIRNRDNIVAKRGALFMIKLKHFVQEQGFTVAHIKTDSIKIPNATPDIIEKVMFFGEEYGYTFEHEATYSKIALVNEAVYVAKYALPEWKAGTWEATGAQFQHPYVYKTLFETDKDIEFDDVCETKQVTKGVMYLDFDAETKPMFMAGKMHHVGRTGRFVPVKENSGGGILYRVQDGKLFAVTGTKGYFWKEAEQLASMGEELALAEQVNFDYFEKLVDDAVKTISKFGDFIEFVS